MFEHEERGARAKLTRSIVRERFFPLPDSLSMSLSCDGGMARETSGQPEACAHHPEVSSCRFVLIIRAPDTIFEAGRSVHFRDYRRNVLPPPC